MLKVKTVLKETPARGIGCFADQDIKFGEEVWVKTIFDLDMSEATIQGAPAIFQEFAEKYGCRQACNIVICIDNARFINHSSIPNIRPTSLSTSVACRDINKGEELLVDYMESCDDDRIYGLPFEVICDETNNSEQDIKDNKVNVDVIFKTGGKK